MTVSISANTLLIEKALVQDDYIPRLNLLAKSISDRCVDAPNEATVVNVFDIQLFLFLRDNFGLEYFPEKEVSVSTVRSIAKGRIDTKVGALVVEFKQPNTLHSTREKESATQQLIEYLEGLYKQNPATSYIGVITDGTKAKLVEMHYGKISQGIFSELNSFHLDTIIKSIVLLDKVALTPENLINDFCKPTKKSLVSTVVNRLYTTLKEQSTERTKMLHQEWKELFKLAHDDTSKQQAIIERSKALSEAIGENLKSNDDEYLALYSLQTTYALIVKIIAYKVTSNAKFDNDFFQFNSLSSASNAALQSTMLRLEDGAIFRDIGIGNLLEGDFFSWYSESAQWNDDISLSVREILSVLSRYEDIAIFGTKDYAQDLFRELYTQIMPDKVRHSLGEFYTPSWLADNVVSHSLSKINNPNWVGLDPCAGSGTFVNAMIQKILQESTHQTDGEKLNDILNRVIGIDLNPLAVLAARVNYFINISPLFSRGTRLNIPVYLGDASYVPEKIQIDGVDFFEYRIKTLKKELPVRLPVSIVSKANDFSEAMTDIEQYIKSLDTDLIVQRILKVASIDDRSNATVISNVYDLAENFVDLERNNWDGIWARIVTNFLLTASLDKVDMIVGNPPWIDWKTLPAGYRERIKSLCVSRHLFSGDRITGGINLNICALITNVAAQKWLKDDGVLAFLMPKPLLFQQSYEGFRNLHLDDNKKLYFDEIHDWTKAGHPFKPVQQEFLTYFLTHTPKDYKKGIPVINYKKKASFKLDTFAKESIYSNMTHVFDISENVAFQSSQQSTAFSYAHSQEEVNSFTSISGSSSYAGREGIEFYPQELFLLKVLDNINDSVMMLENYQNQKSKHKIAYQKIAIEKDSLHPLIKGVNIERFHISNPEYVVPFPYTTENVRVPMSQNSLNIKFPLLAAYLHRNQSILKIQTSYNDRIIGKKDAEFYALARVGKYTFAPYHVAFRDNSKWQAAVVSAKDDWHGLHMPLFQNHAVSISQRPDGSWLTEDEAHYICAILNTPIIGKYIKQSSDSRSFKIRPNVQVPLYIGSERQLSLAHLSRQAHEKYNDKQVIAEIDAKLNKLYIDLITNPQ